MSITDPQFAEVVERLQGQADDFLGRAIHAFHDTDRARFAAKAEGIELAVGFLCVYAGIEPPEDARLAMLGEARMPRI